MRFANPELLWLLLLVPALIVGLSLRYGWRRRVLARLGHLPQIERLARAVSPGRRLLKVILLLFGLLYLGWSQGREFIRENLVFWIAANSFFTGLGAILAGAHILAILTAIIVAPISPLIPAGPGTVAAIVQTAVRPPLVKDFQAFADDVGQLRRWRKNRILRILLVLVLCGLVVGQELLQPPEIQLRFAQADQNVRVGLEVGQQRLAV